MSSIDYGVYMTLVEELSAIRKTKENQKKIDRIKREIEETWSKLNEYEKERGLKLERSLGVL